MKKFCFLIIFTTFFNANSFTSFSIADEYLFQKASYHAPWYACYMEQGGTMRKCVGPFKSKFECFNYRWKLAYGQRWLGCFQ